MSEENKKNSKLPSWMTNPVVVEFSKSETDEKGNERKKKLGRKKI